MGEVKNRSNFKDLGRKAQITFGYMSSRMESAIKFMPNSFLPSQVFCHHYNKACYPAKAIFPCEEETRPFPVLCKFKKS